MGKKTKIMMMFYYFTGMVNFVSEMTANELLHDGWLLHLRLRGKSDFWMFLMIKKMNLLKHNILEENFAIPIGHVNMSSEYLTSKVYFIYRIL